MREHRLAPEWANVVSAVSTARSSTSSADTRDTPPPISHGRDAGRGVVALV